MQLGINVYRTGFSLEDSLELLPKNIEAGLDDGGKQIQAAFEKITDNWNDQPVFVIAKEQNRRTITTTNLNFKFVSGGTKVRYAHMTSDFMAKSQEGMLDSRPGKGGLWYIDKSRPLPGIKARNFDKTLARVYARRFASNFLASIMRSF